ncbi:MAG TPA: Asp-tRNA(Asn)/Glu-tRNA(Gln) amidotransferase subunit GatB [Phycisphaerales bacterium]|nr:Asp-tRNA(Asn)/Glu-tRNA(Gln) amidotransferase subunit GatB [Phycisphaerales bacterium]
MPEITAVKLVVGLEVHVELSCATKAFSRAPSPAHAAYEDAGPNTCIDPVVLGLPGAIPVLNRRAVELSIQVGLALNCQIAATTRFDRKSYFYADMPKGYQISQYDRPLCFDGAIDIPRPLPADQQRGGSVAVDHEAHARRIGIIRAHLEEDAGKLLHDAPGGGAIDHSILDLNRAGTALLEVVTQPDFETAEEAVVFCQTLRDICRFLGASEGVLQKGHMRFEPNVNCHLTLSDGHLVKTPIVEVKNLNSFKAVRAAIEFERREQPQRWLNDGRVMGPGAKQTRGWDDQRGVTYVMREKEDAHDYRYFPDPDLLPISIDAATVASLRDAMPELSLARLKRYARQYALPPKDAAALTDERAVSDLFEAAVAEAVARGLLDTRAGKAVANLLLQSGAKRANERTAADGAEPVLISSLGISAQAVGALAAMREAGTISAAGADELFGLLCQPGQRTADPAILAAERGLLVVKDDAAIDAWVQQAIDANPQAAADVRAGKEAAAGRIVGAAAKLSAGKADAADLRKRIMARLSRA